MVLKPLEKKQEIEETQPEKEMRKTKERAGSKANVGQEKGIYDPDLNEHLVWELNQGAMQ